MVVMENMPVVFKPSCFIHCAREIVVYCMAAVMPYEVVVVVVLIHSAAPVSAG